MHVRVSAKGAVQLGDVVACDGFIYECKVRVQTHVHVDHLDKFDTSKGYQDILMTPPTRELLIAEFNGDLAYRENIEAVPPGLLVERGGCEILLLDNGHMLGSAQVAVTLPDGTRCGYSGDFSWPLDEVIQVDELVVDTTYGSPESIRHFTSEQATQQLAELVVDRIRLGPVFIKAHRGTLQRALSCLDDTIVCPMLATPRVYKEVGVYRQHGYSLTQVLDPFSPDVKQIVRTGRYIKISETRDPVPPMPPNATSIILSAYMGGKKNPLTQYSEKAYNLSLSGHADFNGTLEFIQATGATRVLTDNTRGGHAAELALAVRRLLGIQAEPSEVDLSREWGQ